jgi:stage V sporulation protein G
MEITEVRIKLMEDPQERLQAFCSITFDHSFVIRDLKIIEGTKGSFVAMPSRKLTDRCPQCHTKNQLRALFCNQCGARLKEDRAVKDDEGRAKLYADIAHPINSRCRELIQTEVIKAFREEQIRAKQPGYICSYDDYGEESFATLEEEGATIRLHRTVGEPDSVHRIDQPSNGINAPHHGAPRIAGRVSAEREEGFGSGIL